MDATHRTHVVLAHEPGRGWLEYLRTDDFKVAEAASEAALSEGFDAAEIR